MDESDHLVGIVTNRDLRFERDMNRSVDEVMTKENLSQIYQVDFEILTIAGKPLSIYY